VPNLNSTSLERSLGFQLNRPGAVRSPIVPPPYARDKSVT